MMGGVPRDWLSREWIRGIRGDEGPPSKFPSSTIMPPRFGTDNSNLPLSSLYPRVIGNKTQGSYDLTHAVGTITQIDKCSFDKAFDGNGRYPTNREVRVYVHRCL